jgi:integrase
MMGHGSKKMVYEVYGQWPEGLENDIEKIRKFMGDDF